jgi:hypothetical protein
MRKFIAQRTFYDFVYPNNNKAQYDVNDVVQNINSNIVSGTVTNFVATLVGGQLQVDFNYTWSKNGAEVFTNQAGGINVISLHVMPAGVTYFKPWRCVDVITAISGSTGASGVFSDTYSASLLGVPSLSNGTYYFEIRMIGALENYIITQQYTIGSSPTPGLSPTPTSSPGTSPTPTPSVTATSGLSPTPTPTQTSTPGAPASSPTPTPTPTNTGTPTGTPGASPTPTQTPSPSPPGVYFTYNITGGYPTSGDACLEGSAVTQIYGATALFLDNAIFYDSPYLTSPYVGSSLFYKNTGTNEWTQIDNSGNNVAEGNC